MLKKLTTLRSGTHFNQFVPFDGLSYNNRADQYIMAHELVRENEENQHRSLIELMDSKAFQLSDMKKSSSDDFPTSGAV